MPRRTLLSVEQRARLFAVPTDRAAMARHYVLGADDLAMVRSKRRAANRLGFAVQLCLLRHPGGGLGPGERPREAMLAFVVRQLGVPVARTNELASWYAQAPGGMVEKPLYCYLCLLYQSESVFHVSMHRIPAREGMISRMTTNSRLPLST
jgi:hypothetical protein